jgi:hypothetical protein
MVLDGGASKSSELAVQGGGGSDRRGPRHGGAPVLGSGEEGSSP